MKALLLDDNLIDWHFRLNACFCDRSSACCGRRATRCVSIRLNIDNFSVFCNRWVLHCQALNSWCHIGYEVATSIEGKNFPGSWIKFAYKHPALPPFIVLKAKTAWFRNRWQKAPQQRRSSLRGWLAFEKTGHPRQKHRLLKRREQPIRWVRFCQR